MADEDPLYNNCIEPHSFCMRAMRCDYCGAPETKSVLIEYLYGIQACNQHHGLAQRDCKAELAKQGMVRYKDAAAVPECAELFKILKQGFKVTRSNGTVESGWSLRSQYDIIDPSFLYRLDGDWSIPACNVPQCTEQVIKKSIRLIWFLQPERLKEFPPNFASVCNAALAALDRGVYKAELDSYNANIIHSKPSCVAEHPDVGKAILPDGQIVRVLNHYAK